ncbi:hypothetical protein ARHIZOSPH14_29530 [Agromyces rhizosphaerae]|uniref:Uncharacterized protein n=1 Tax=Agromyces rhizosphaerae TaxID=88374 RepID=A0A9W6FQM4_9MICO|nr:hypothetical protein [Agromyces rhizosphaerae]GLI28711.1 hypothetical protein ARHIZOSPH14_29530 [Agromyces rhizosphaerae]
MQWWNAFTEWLFDPETLPVLFTAGVLFLAVLVSGLLAAWISRSAVRGLVTRQERELRSSAVAALVDAATEASVWNSLTPQEQVLSDRAVGLADVRLRLLPVKGADVAANWASHQLHELKRASATFGYQLDPAVGEFRDRMVQWQRHPGRMRRQFQADLERWRTQDTRPEQAVVEQQDEWVAQQHHDRYSDTQAAPTTDAAEPAPPATEAPAEERPVTIGAPQPRQDATPTGSTPVAR